jgi:hypothetical protein
MAYGQSNLKLINTESIENIDKEGKIDGQYIKALMLAVGLSCRRRGQVEVRVEQQMRNLLKHDSVLACGVLLFGSLGSARR